MLALCFICFWIFMTMALIYSVIAAFKEAISHLKKLHQIPCHKCDYFTNDYRLKCPVNPTVACTEEAISCRDFEVQTANSNSYHRGRWKMY